MSCLVGAWRDLRNIPCAQRNTSPTCNTTTPSFSSTFLLYNIFCMCTTCICLAIMAATSSSLPHSFVCDSCHQPRNESQPPLLATKRPICRACFHRLLRPGFQNGLEDDAMLPLLYKRATVDVSQFRGLVPDEEKSKHTWRKAADYCTQFFTVRSVTTMFRAFMQVWMWSEMPFAEIALKKWYCRCLKLQSTTSRIIPLNGATPSLNSKHSSETTWSRTIWSASI